MDTSKKYRKESEGYSPYLVHYRKSFKYHHSHERFVVPWQMDNGKQVKETEK